MELRGIRDQRLTSPDLHSKGGFPDDMIRKKILRYSMEG